MKTKPLSCDIVISLCLLWLTTRTQAQATLQTPQKLRVEYLSNPLGIDVSKPRFQWYYETESLHPRGLMQKAYQLNVSKVDPVTRNVTPVWDSGQVMSNATSQIQYNGESLQSDSDYEWSVRWWNDTNMPPSSFSRGTFSTALMNESEWIAEWIGRPPSVGGLRSAAESVSDSARFRAEFNLPANLTVVRARAYVTGLGYYKLLVNGERVSTHELGPQTFFPARVLYDTLDLRYNLVAGPNAVGIRTGPGFWSVDFKGKLWAMLQLHITLENGTVLVVSTHAQSTCSLGPLRYASNAHVQILPTTWRVHDDPCIKSQMYQGETYDARLDTPMWDKAGYDDSSWPKAYSPSLDQCAVVEEHGHVILGCSDANQEIVDINFASFGTPSGSCSSPCHSENTFKINEKCNAENSTAIVKQMCLGHRMCALSVSKDLFGDPCRQVVKHLAVSISCGEQDRVYLWQPASDEHPLSNDQIYGIQSLTASVLPNVGKRSSNPMAKIGAESVTPSRVYELAGGVFVMDLGQNIAGTCDVSVNGSRGDIITLIKGEELFANGSVKNQLKVNMTSVFILNGSQSVERLSSSWIYYGFQYVEIHGLPSWASPSTAVICKRMHSELTTAGYAMFGAEGGDDEQGSLLNRIQSAIVLTQLNNLFSIPTDCPNREKRGWMGDAQVTALVAIWNLDMAAFYSNWIRSMEDVQIYNAVHHNTKGLVPDIVPAASAPSSTDATWSSAYMLISWYVYQHYKDLSLLQRHYDGYKKYVDYLTTTTDNSTGLLLFHKYGDWCNTYPRRYEIPTTGPISACFHYILDLQLLSGFAELLGNREDAQHYAEMHAKLMSPFHEHFFNSSVGAYVDGSQTVNLLPLFGGLVPEEHAGGVAKHVIDDIVTAHQMHLTTGAVGTRFLLPVLTELGRIDVALALANQSSFPSWGYWMTKGATTLWENWSGEADLTHPPPPTHDHIFLGSQGSWLYEGLVGLSQRTLGFDHVILRPPQTRLSSNAIADICSNNPTSSLLSLQQARALHTGVHGDIVFQWQFGYNASVPFYTSISLPPNCVAEVYIPVQATCSQRAASSQNAHKAAAMVTILERSDGPVWKDGHFVPGVDGVYSAEFDQDARAVVLSCGSGFLEFYLLS